MKEVKCTIRKTSRIQRHDEFIILLFPLVPISKPTQGHGRKTWCFDGGEAEVCRQVRHRQVKHRGPGAVPRTSVMQAKRQACRVMPARGLGNQ